MKKSKISIIVPALFGVVATLSPMQAHAMGEDIPFIVASYVKAAANSVAEIAAAAANSASQIADRHLVAGAQAARISGEIQRGTIANAKIQDAVLQNQYALEKNGKMIDMAAKLAPPADGCKGLTVAKSIKQSEAQADTTRMALAAIASRTTAQNSNPGQAQADARLLQNRYCSPLDQQRGRCSSVSAMPGADLDSSSLFVGAATVAGASGAAPKPITYTYTREEMQAAFDYAKNITAGLVQPNLAVGDEKAPQGMDYVAQQRRQAAVASLIQNTLIDVATRRTPAVKRGEQGKNISMLEMIKSDIDRRYANPDWYMKSARLPVESSMRDMVQISAQNVYLSFLQFRQGENIEALLAASLAASARK